LRRFLRIYDGSGKILDVGCATGLFYGILQHYYPKISYVGIDITPLFIESAKRKYPGATFLVGDASKTKFMNESFDAVLSQQVVSFSRDPKKLLQEMYRVSKRYLIFDVILRERGKTINDASLSCQKVAGSGGKAIYNVFNLDEFLTWIKEMKPTPKIIEGNYIRFNVQWTKNLVFPTAEIGDRFYNATFVVEKGDGENEPEVKINRSSDIIYRLKCLALKFLRD
jgi:SAM-dependent methyltransferase